MPIRLFGRATDMYRYGLYGSRDMKKDTYFFLGIRLLGFMMYFFFIIEQKLDRSLKFSNTWPLQSPTSFYLSFSVFSEMHWNKGMKRLLTAPNLSSACSNSQEKGIRKIPWKHCKNKYNIKLSRVYEMFRYIFGTDKLRPNAFEVRGMDGSSTGTALPMFNFNLE